MKQTGRQETLMWNWRGQVLVIEGDTLASGLSDYLGHGLITVGFGG